MRHEKAIEVIYPFRCATTPDFNIGATAVDRIDESQARRELFLFLRMSETMIEATSSCWPAAVGDPRWAAPGIEIGSFLAQLCRTFDERNLVLNQCV
jgi:hypothetical protein